MLLVFNLRLQAFTPSDHLRTKLLLPSPPQFLNQAPPGAQQLSLPDFRNAPHVGHVIVFEVIDGGLADVLIGVLAMSSRSGIEYRRGSGIECRRESCCLTGVLHADRDIDP